MRDSPRLSRRRFLAGIAALGAGAAGVAVDVFAIAPRRVDISRFDVPIAGLPPALDGVRIAHITDVHLYDGLHAAARATMGYMASERPDLTLLTGDMCENGPSLPALREFTEACRGSSATAATLGNWERWIRKRPERLRQVYEAGGGELLINQSSVLEFRGARIAIVGLDDPRRGKPDPVAALSGTEGADLSIWLFHAPGYADVIPSDLGVRPALMLSGHTHGGQIRVPLVPPVTPVGSGRFVEGWYRDTFAPMYVSRGIGTSEIRGRFRCPAELVFLTLRAG
jgi:hypothetical protein